MEDQVSSAVTCALRHIGLGTYSSGKIREYLLAKGYSCDVTDDAVNELILRKYIDDEKAGRKVLLSRIGKKQESRALLFKRLIAAGIPDNVASDISGSLDDDITTCTRLFDACFSDPSVLDPDPQQACMEAIKIAGKRGYTPEVASKAFRSWLSEN